MNDRAPDLTQKVLGYRLFRVVGGGFCSIGVGDYRWDPGPNRARCLGLQVRGGPQHDSPARACPCGLYAYHRLSGDWLLPATIPHYAPEELGAYVAAAVLAWGRMQIHPSGFRAEHAEIMLIGFEPSNSPRQVAEIRWAARAYGVRLVGMQDFVVEARELGDSVPGHLIPERLEQVAPSPMAGVTFSGLSAPEPRRKRSRAAKLAVGAWTGAVTVNATAFVLRPNVFSLVMAAISLLVVVSLILWPPATREPAK